MGPKIRKILLITAISVIPTILLWLPFYLRLTSFWNIPLANDGMATVVSNYDGPLYIVVAKTLYNPQAIKNNYSFNLPVEYYAAHFPMYPLLVKPVAMVVGFPYATLIVTLASSILALYFFNKLISQHVTKSNSAWLTFLFAIFPARWLVVRSIGSPEPLFIAAIIASVYYFNNKKYWPAAFWGAIAQLTKSPGILLFAAYMGAIIIPKFQKLATAQINKVTKIINYKSYPVLLIPFALLVVFTIYKYTLNDFFAYFNSGDNIHLFFPPFQIFNYSAPWVNTHWLEEIVFVYFVCTLGFLKLIEQKQVVYAWFVGIFLTSLFFVSHRDLIRYALPIIPFLYVAFADTLSKKEIKIAVAIIIIPIYLFSLAFISKNVMPISNWSPLL